MKKLIIVLILILFTVPSFVQDENFCNDKESWKEWNKLALKYPQDMDVQMLHAVRIGFCKKNNDGTISFKMANEIFNRLHESVIKKSKEQQEDESNEHYAMRMYIDSGHKDSSDESIQATVDMNPNGFFEHPSSTRRYPIIPPIVIKIRLAVPNATISHFCLFSIFNFIFK